MNVKTLDGVNIGLMIIALALAYVMPFGIFLVGYAVLGPLHYLTEVNWLHQKNYFTSSKYWVFISVIAAVLVTLPKILIFLGLTDYKLVSAVSGFLNEISNGLLFLGIWSAAVLLFVSNAKWQWLLILLGAVMAYLVNGLPPYSVIIGALLPTVLHVYLFTGLFMLYGALKSQSRIGLLTVLLLSLVPVVIGILPVEPSLWGLNEYTKSAFMENKFFAVNLEIGKMLGFTDGASFYFFGTWETKVQTFLAFAYIYHYLNWFSKTSFIGWHKGLKGKKAVAIICVWLVHVSLFVFDYRLGFMAALTLSFWHVIAEFPLNALSIKGIAQHVKQSLYE